MTNNCVGELGHHWFRQWIVVWSAPSRCLNHYASSTGITAVRKFTCAIGCRYSPHRFQRNGKSILKNELTNQKFDSNSKTNLACRQHHKCSPSRFSISKKAVLDAKQSWSLKQSYDYGMFGRSQHWYLAATGNVTVANSKTMVAVVYLPYPITQN